MAHATPFTVFRNAGPALDLRPGASTCRTQEADALSSELHFSLHRSFDEIEAEWRRFEQIADCTPFQTFAWLAAWQRHVGCRLGVRPLLVLASFADGQTALILPLGIERSALGRRLCWLGYDVNDYNAPLVARDFSQRIPADRFRAAWAELRLRLQREPLLRHDWIDLDKMPQKLGAQINPLINLGVAPNPSGAHFTLLGDDWQSFYDAKRSSATRRRDRTKRKRMAEHGEIRFLTVDDTDGARRTLDILMQQKSRLLESRGIPDMFSRPGWREFFLDIASNPASRHLVHISRIEIGSDCAAANLGVVFGQSYYHMLSSYDDGDLARHGPGALHLRELMAYAIGRRLRRFDFTVGDEPYKLEWSDFDVTLWDHSTAASWRGLPANALKVVRRRLKRFMKQTPFTWRLVGRWRASVAALSRRWWAARSTRSLPQSPAAAGATGAAVPTTSACVMGDMDLLQPLTAGGIRCAVVARPGSPALYSRFAKPRLAWDDFSTDADALVSALLRFGKAQNEPPVLFYQEDAHLLAISRFRDQLAQAFRFVIADAPLVEDLVDKARFQNLATRRGLPVPRAQQFNPATIAPAALDVRFPLVIKPLTRLERWNERMGRHKAIAAESPEALRALWPQLTDIGVDLLAQELVAGGEAQLESYHCYIDRGGNVVGEFTGRKIRTYPRGYGHTCALEITDVADVKRQGRAIAEQLGLTGVAKFDFKRDRRGKLQLLEINPRFTLWHHPAAIAGINIPALVFADLTGMPRPAVARARSSVRWCRVWSDFPAARAASVPLTQWLAAVWRCEAKSSLSWRDPMPAVGPLLHRLIGRHVTDKAGAAPGARHWVGS